VSFVILLQKNKNLSRHFKYQRNLSFLFLGDKVMVAIKGQKRKGIIVGCKQYQKAMIPKFDSNNLVLIDDNGSPLGTRIHVPIPNVLRTILRKKTIAKGADYTKVLAIASRYV